MRDGDGLVTDANARGVTVKYDDGDEVTYPMIKFVRSNAGTCLNQRPSVTKGDRVVQGRHAHRQLIHRQG